MRIGPFRSPRGTALALLAVLWTTAGVAGEGAFSWTDAPEAGAAELRFGDQPVLRYQYAYDPSTSERAHETYKVYHHVFGPGTGALITKGPGGLYTHHRGLYVGWNKTIFDGSQLDFWHCPGGTHQKHVRFLEKSGNADAGSMAAEIHWNDPEGEPVIAETRTVVARRIDAGMRPAWQIDWTSTLESRRGEITLDGDRQHAGFQFRAAQPVADSEGATFLRPAAFPQRPEAVQVGDAGDPPPHIDLGWFAMTYELEGTRYTVEYFEDPSLPKPSLFSERPYGRFGAFFRATLTPDEPLTLRYRVVVTSGAAPSPAEIQARYDDFVTSLETRAP